MDGKKQNLMPRTILVNKTDWEKFSSLCQQQDTSVSRRLREFMKDAVLSEIKMGTVRMDGGNDT